MEFGSSILADVWGLETARDVQIHDLKRLALRDKFKRIELELGSGPLFGGPEFSLVDAVFAPIFRYFDVFDAISPTGVLDGLEKVADWRRNLATGRACARRSTGTIPSNSWPYWCGMKHGC